MLWLDGLFDRTRQVCQHAPMLRLPRKFIAVLMLLWLPLSGTSAIAASLSMQAPRDACHEAAMQMDEHEAMDQDAMHHQMDAQDQSDSSCSSCGVCHLACTGYLAVPDVATLNFPLGVAAVTPYLFSFHSITSTPLDPPPLARV